MEKSQWKEIIKEACEAAGTYQPHFDCVIDTLSGIMEIRDRAQAQYELYGAEPVLKQVSKTKGVQFSKNPMLSAMLDCNAQALSYWRDLGLTPAGFKKLEGSVKPEGTSFESLFEGIGL